MKLFAQRKYLISRLRECLPMLLLLGTLAVFTKAQPVLWPGGFGFSETHVDDSLLSNSEKTSDSKDTQKHRTVRSGKTLWDWMSLLGVPLSLAILGAWLQNSQRRQTEAVAKEQRERTENEFREEALQTYYDRISVLLVDNNLLGITCAEIDEEPAKRELVKTSVGVIRARTLSILRRFEADSERKTSIIRFLIETKTISSLEISMKGADLSGVDLSGVDLIRTDLSGANLANANLVGANLTRANLNRVNFTGSKLVNTVFTKANLSYANFDSAIIHGAVFVGADLSRAVLVKSDLSGANLIQATLEGANFSDVRFDKNTLWPDKAKLITAKNVPII